MATVSHIAVIFPSTIEADDGRPAIPMEKLTWRDDIEMMYLDETGTGPHIGARFVGNVINIRREMIVGEPWVVGDVRYATDSQNPEIAERARLAQQMADEDRINGLSADLAIKVTEVDEDGFPIDFEATLIGVTQAPMQAFDGARIYTAADFPGTIATEPVTVLASAAPRESFFIPEPPDDDPRYVKQPHGELAIPLTIEGRQFYGHAGVTGQCHTGFLNKCITPPESPSNYALFHTNVTRCEDGDVETGTVVWRGDHAPITADADGARDHYAHHAYAWGDARAVNGRHGIWVCGVIRDEVSDDEIEILRRSTWSGDWRNGEMVGLLTVNQSAFPVARIAASGGVAALVASGQVQRDDEETTEPQGDEPPSLSDLAAQVAGLHEKVDRLLPQEEASGAEAEVVNLESGRIARVLGQ